MFEQFNLKWIRNLDRFRKDRIGYSSELKPWQLINILNPLKVVHVLKNRVEALNFKVINSSSSVITPFVPARVNFC